MTRQFRQITETTPLLLLPSGMVELRDEEGPASPELMNLATGQVASMGRGSVELGHFSVAELRDPEVSVEAADRPFGWSAELCLEGDEIVLGLRPPPCSACADGDGWPGCDCREKEEERMPLEDFLAKKGLVLR